MALDKAIKSGKEHRKQYRGSKAIDRSCRNHGSCDWCRENRLHKFRKIGDIEAEAERTAKVIDHKIYLSINLNVVGSPTIGHEYLCSACKKKVLIGDDYCSHCGAELDWSDHEIT